MKVNSAILAAAILWTTINAKNEPTRPIAFVSSATSKSASVAPTITAAPSTRKTSLGTTPIPSKLEAVEQQLSQVFKDLNKELYRLFFGRVLGVGDEGEANLAKRTRRQLGENREVSYPPRLSISTEDDIHIEESNVRNGDVASPVRRFYPEPSKVFLQQSRSAKRKEHNTEAKRSLNPSFPSMTSSLQQSGYLDAFEKFKSVDNQPPYEDLQVDPFNSYQGGGGEQAPTPWRGRRDYRPNLGSALSLSEIPKTKMERLRNQDGTASRKKEADDEILTTPSNGTTTQNGAPDSGEPIDDISLSSSSSSNYETTSNDTPSFEATSEEPITSFTVDMVEVEGESSKPAAVSMEESGVLDMESVDSLKDQHFVNMMDYDDHLEPMEILEEEATEGLPEYASSDQETIQVLPDIKIIDEYPMLK